MIHDPLQCTKDGAMWRVVNFGDIRNEKASPIMNSKIIQVSEPLALFFGRNPNELINQKLSIFLPKNNTNLYLQYGAKLVNQIESVGSYLNIKADSIYQHFDNTLYHVVIETAIFMDKENYGGFSFGFIKDIKRIEKEEEINAIYENAGNLIVIEKSSNPSQLDPKN